jgi:hypothetical protein
MEPTTRRILIIIAVVLLVLCLCLGILLVLGYSFFAINSQVTAEAPLVVTEEITVPAPVFEATPDLDTPGATETANSTLESDLDPTPGEAAQPSSSELPADIAAQMDEIEEQVIELRGLTPNGEVDRALLSPAELRQHVTEDFLEDYTAEEARDDALTLAAFGLLEPEFDLYDFYIELFSEQVAGFYDDETTKMYVIQDQGFRGPQRLTYAHEYVHALQDLTYDIETGLGYSDEACEEDSERCAAIQALLEGDASFLEIEWFTNFSTRQDQREIQEFYSNYESPIYDRAPAFMREDFIFPYLSGQTFVEYLHNQGGWPAVDRAYANPPVSTEQILHPERYPDDVPIPVELPDLEETLGEGWREIDRGVMGEWFTYLILAFGLDEGARLDIAQAQAAAEGWGGDSYIVYYNEEAGQTVMVLHTQWESEGDANEFNLTFHEYAGQRFGSPVSQSAGFTAWESGGWTEFQINGEFTTWILAPDQETAQSIYSLIENTGN